MAGPVTALPGHDRVIVTIDLRDIDPASLTSRRFAEAQAERVPGGAARLVDFGRVIVIDDTKVLAQHHDVYSHILDSHVEVRLLCLAVGPGPSDDPTIAVCRPFQLGPPKAATLWVGDTDGIGWRMDSTQADLVHLPGLAEADGAFTGLPGLLEVLRLPHVFDQVVEIAGAMPGAAACPGIRVARSDSDPDEMAAAQRAAIRVLAGPAGGTAAGSAGVLLPAGSGVPRSAPGQRPDRVTDVVRPGGSADQMFQRCRRAAQDAVASAQQLAGLNGLLSGNGREARGAFGRFADALADFSTMIGRVLQMADTRGGFEAGQREQLARLGIDLGPAHAGDPAQALEPIRDLALAALEQGQALPLLAERLRDTADRLVPQGTARYVGRLSHICPEAALRRLRTPPALPARIPSLRMLAATFLACLLAGLWPILGVGCAALAVLGVTSASAWVGTRVAALTGARRTAAVRFALLQLASGFIGAGSGLALARLVRLPVPAGPAGAALGLLLTSALVVALSLWWWRLLAGQWSRSLRLPRLAQAADGMRDLIAETVRDEWQVAEERATASDYARIMAGVVDDIASGLRSHAAGLPETERQPGQPVDQAMVIRDLVRVDLTAVVVDTLARLTGGPGASALGAVDGATVRAELNARLCDYSRYLASCGLHQPPPFGAGAPRRRALVRTLAERATDVLELVRSGVKDERITQLCTPGQLMLLETDAGMADLLTFAPQAMQDLTAATGRRPAVRARDHPIVWTEVRPLAGVLRLVPLRASAVQAVWPASESGPGPACGSSDHGWVGEEGEAGA